MDTTKDSSLTEVQPQMRHSGMKIQAQFLLQSFHSVQSQIHHHQVTIIHLVFLTIHKHQEMHLHMF